ncbi:MAG TPA: GNAT family N-acetyltransferase [Thermoclostridium sp.]
MITYKRCTETDEDALFEAFQTGFSDYIIRIEMTKDLFIKHFFGPEGNRPEYSFIAFDDNLPVGLVLGGIKVYEGIKTLRCGALCVHPDYRGTEVSRELFNLHREIALENHCRQMFLEVIVGNDRAINFYRKKGYEKVYDLVYYSHNNPAEINAPLPNDVTIKRMDLDGLIKLSEETRDIHINWQNDFDYISHMNDLVHYGVYKGVSLIGGLSIHPKGRINFLWIEPMFRNTGVGKGLISRAVKELNPGRLTISFPNNAALLGFVRHLNFTKDPISQYEMYFTL